MVVTLPLVVSQLTPYHWQWSNDTFSSQPSLTGHSFSFPPVLKKSDFNPSLSAASTIQANEHHQHKNHAAINHDKGDTLLKCALVIVPITGVTCCNRAASGGINSYNLRYHIYAGVLWGSNRDLNSILMKLGIRLVSFHLNRTRWWMIAYIPQQCTDRKRAYTSDTNSSSQG